MKKIFNFILISVLALSIGFSIGAWKYVEAKSHDIAVMDVCNEKLDELDRAMATLGCSDRIKNSIILSDGTMISIVAVYESGVRTNATVELYYDGEI